MTPEASQSQVNTRHLKLPNVEAPITPSATGPLDLKRPWVVEFRVVGTASTLQVRVGDAMMIGRGDTASGYAPEVDLTAFDAFAKGVSRKHAMITIKDQRLMVRDLNSTNGTRLNNVVCKPGEEYRLRHGNELMLGTLRLQVSFAVVPALTDTQRVPSATKETANPTVSGNGKRVLVIEDDHDVGNVFRMALEYAGYKVLLVNDVTKALGVVFQGMPDAIILDLMLPDMNGLDLVRYVRKQKTPKHIPMLVVSGAIGGFQMNQALAAGADAFLGKPVAVEELVQAVGNAVKLGAPSPSTPSAPPPSTSNLKPLAGSSPA
ncbi:MAG: response regulator [Chloroflexi bacterium]|nr:response regulator [Chloroflexota bacterium]